MTAVRVAGRAVVGAALVLVCVAAMLWARFGPQGAWTLAWIGVVFVVVSCAVPAWIALQPKADGDGAYPEDWQEQGWCCRECAVTAWHGIRGSDG